MELLSTYNAYLGKLPTLELRDAYLFIVSAAVVS